MALSVSGGLLAACGDEDGETATKQLTKGTIELGGYPDWIGSKNLQDFAAANPGDQVKQVSIPSTRTGSPGLATDPEAVDIMLITEKDVQRLIDLDVAAEVDLSAVPNYDNINEEFKFGYASGSNPRCVTTDYGKTGFAYRNDMVDEDLRSWSDVFDVAEKYEGQITFLDFPAFVIGSGLIVNGESISSTDPEVVGRPPTA